MIRAEDAMEAYDAAVSLRDPDSMLNVRNAPDITAGRIGRLKDGTPVTVLDEPAPGWLHVSYAGGVGYVSAEYIARQEPVTPEDEAVPMTTSLIDELGNVVTIMGLWRIAED